MVYIFSRFSADWRNGDVWLSYSFGSRELIAVALFGALGALNIIIGLIMIVTGSTDEAR